MLKNSYISLRLLALISVLLLSARVTLHSDDGDSLPSSNIKFSMLPAFEFNRVNSIFLGLSPKLSLWHNELSASAGYSFGLRRPLGTISIKTPFYTDRDIEYGFTGSLFSWIETMSDLKYYSRFLNSLMAAGFHDDYYDYFRKDGWSAGAIARLRHTEVTAGFELSRQLSLKVNTNRSILENSKWRDNPRINNGTYRILTLSFSYGYILPAIFHSFQYKLFVNGLYGNRQGIKYNFGSSEAQLYIMAPTFSVGDSNYMLLNIALRGGYATDSLPVQYQFRQPTKLNFLSSFGYYYTAPEAYYGGTSFFGIHVNFNTKDLWWRKLNLPLYENKGIDLVLAASAGTYNSKASYGYRPTWPFFYSEAGFGFGSIPLFLIKDSYMSVDLRFGFGPLAGGLFGWGLGFTLPFLPTEINH